jgi:hypothetical protein
MEESEEHKSAANHGAIQNQFSANRLRQQQQQKLVEADYQDENDSPPQNVSE